MEAEQIIVGRVRARDAIAGTVEVATGEGVRRLSYPASLAATLFEMTSSRRFAQFVVRGTTILDLDVVPG